jgi:hypothetical protein
MVFGVVRHSMSNDFDNCVDVCSLLRILYFNVIIYLVVMGLYTLWWVSGFSVF